MTSAGLSPAAAVLQILYQRLKVPPSINQFTKTIEKNQAVELFKLLSKYKPETKQVSRVPAPYSIPCTHVASLISSDADISSVADEYGVRSDFDEYVLHHVCP